jgi:glycosyltransferase involved in cell wall biosynthesis
MGTEKRLSPRKILMLAPEPFFQPRGTPISIYFRLKALSDLGHRVDLLTYPIGENMHFPGVKIMRTPSFPGIKTIRIGPSAAKLPLDFLLMCKTLARMTLERYDLVFSHEEAGWWGTLLARTWNIPHLYDMHSSLPQQLDNFEFARSVLFKGTFLWLERFVLKRSGAVITICPDLNNIVKREGFEKKTVLLENFLEFDHPAYSPRDINSIRSRYAPGGEKIVLYAGNFQPYQGVKRLVEAFTKLAPDPAILLLVGEKGKELQAMKDYAAEKGVARRVKFTGQVPPQEVPLYIGAADALVSPRLSGTNTPLKIYSFLKSGKPVVATRLWTHTQVLDDRIALLTGTEPEAMADGIRRALFSDEGRKTAEAAKRFADKKYSYARYRDKLTLALKKALGQEET